MNFTSNSAGLLRGRNIGFFDVCHRPYEPLADAAREAHDRFYALARIEVDPYGDALAYLTSR